MGRLSSNISSRPKFAEVWLSLLRKRCHAQSQISAEKNTKRSDPEHFTHPLFDLPLRASYGATDTQSSVLPTRPSQTPQSNQREEAQIRNILAHSHSRRHPRNHRNVPTLTVSCAYATIWLLLTISPASAIASLTAVALLPSPLASSAMRPAMPHATATCALHVAADGGMVGLRTPATSCQFLKIRSGTRPQPPD